MDISVLDGFCGFDGFWGLIDFIGSYGLDGFLWFLSGF